MTLYGVQYSTWESTHIEGNLLYRTKEEAIAEAERLTHNYMNSPRMKAILEKYPKYLPDVSYSVEEFEVVDYV